MTMRWISAAVAAAGVAVVAASAPLAQTNGTGANAETGHDLAKKLCASCHLVEGGQVTGLPAGLPSFRSIANRPGQTGDKLTYVMIQPHPPMPDTRLTRAEILHLLAYLESLRPADAEPLLPSGAKAEPKPEYPTPS